MKFLSLTSYNSLNGLSVKVFSPTLWMIVKLRFRVQEGYCDTTSYKLVTRFRSVLLLRSDVVKCKKFDKCTTSIYENEKHSLSLFSSINDLWLYKLSINGYYRFDGYYRFNRYYMDIIRIFLHNMIFIYNLNTYEYEVY